MIEVDKQTIHTNQTLKFLEISINTHTRKRNSMLKKLERYLSMRKRSKAGAEDPETKAGRGRVAPTGCFTVYVGPEKQRFVIKTEYANHPLFKMLLEDAELEYGFTSDGPLQLPCHVDLFCKILAQIHAAKDDDDGDYVHVYGYGGACSPFVNPGRRLGRSEMGRGCASYGLLTPPRFVRINHF